MVFNLNQLVCGRRSARHQATTIACQQTVAEVILTVPYPD